MEFRWSQYLFAVVTGMALTSSVHAADLELLLMPGEVIAGHAKVEAECSACHVAFARERQNSLCIDCHQEVGADQTSALGFHGLHPEANSADCSTCHTEHTGRNASIVILNKKSFNHDYTDFALADKHGEVECDDCHQPDTLFRDAPSNCFACHREDDVHEGGLGEDCASCHAPKGWDVVEFEHEIETGFPLMGGHTDVTCNACHVEQNFTNTESQCVACHRDDDVHENRRGEDCASCHTARRWDELLFDHARKTDFPLLGAHAVASCEQCHAEGTVNVQLESTCISCHREDDEHKGLLGTDCASCHGEVAWTDNSFKHDTFTKFPLLGNHATLECEACHAAPVHESNPDTDCFACHVDDDPHAGQQGEACGDCHNETDWTQDVRFDHDFTSFPLIGNHKQAQCDACHETSQFRDASAGCSDCHREDDAHKGGLGTDCGSCHSPVDWSRWRFDHFLSAGFVLDGAHADLRCADCHRSPPQQGRKTAARCVDCHRNDDAHTGQFGKDCARCHSTNTFLGAEER
jgi:hypothetical protein